MKKVFVLMLLVFAFSAMLAAQTGTEVGVYSVNYYSNANSGADQFLRIINPGTTGTPLTQGHGTICADIYVFDANQEMLECCSCPISANGLLELSVVTNLIASPLTGFPGPNSGAIKIVSDAGANCNALAPVPTLELLSWATHVQQPVAGAFVTTETASRFAPLNDAELAFLGSACSFVQYLGSGKGVCTCPVI